MPCSSVALPDPIRHVLERLEAAGSDAVACGRCVRELLSGQTPRDFEILTDADPATVLERFERAVPIRARVAMLPTPAGPVDIRSLDEGEDLASHLVGRDLTAHAIAWRRCGEVFIDPTHGRDDLRARRLRTTRAPERVFAEQPARALEIARIVAEHGFDVDPEVEIAMSKSAPRLATPGGRDLRIEIERLLEGRHAATALGLLARAGILGALIPGIGDDAPAVVSHLPADRLLRLTACLRGTRARAVLRRYRAPRDQAARVERLLQLHPIDAGSRSEREGRARRLARREASEGVRLAALRQAEIHARGEGADAQARLDRFVESVAHARGADEAASRRSTLAIDGRGVMAHLGCGPGARVGRALRFLAAQIADDPARNEPETLRGLLDAWSARERDGDTGGPDLA